MSKPALSTPSPDPAKLCRVQQYLVRERRILPVMVQSLMESANLHADHRANDVFQTALLPWAPNCGEPRRDHGKGWPLAPKRTMAFSRSRRPRVQPVFWSSRLSMA